MTKSSFPTQRALVLLAGLALPFASPLAQAEQTAPQVARLPLEKTLKGPINAIITQVVDGDTVKVEVQTWLNQTLNTSVRIDGIDTPELRGRCDLERDKAQDARAMVNRLAPVGTLVTLHRISSGKYANRVVAEVITPDGQSLAQALLDAQLARPYDGGRRQPWCP